MFCPICGEEIEERSFESHMKGTHTEEEIAHLVLSQTPSLPPEVRIVRGENFAKHYATNFEVMPTRFDIRIDALNERRTTPPELGRPEIVEFISEGQIIMQPFAAKRLVEQLRSAIEHFEKVQGIIVVPEEG